MTGKTWAAIIVGHAFASMYYHTKYVCAKTQKKLTEERSTQMALQPMLMAERDRAYISHWKKVVEAEKDLMSEVPDWEVGTWWGLKVFKTVPDEM